MGKDEWKVKDLLALMKNVLVSILKGRLLLKLDAGRFFVHITYAFFIMALVIWASLAIDSSLMDVEKNKNTIHELAILKSEKKYEVAALSRRASVAVMLQNMGSAVTEPEQPANVIE